MNRHNFILSLVSLLLAPLALLRRKPPEEEASPVNVTEEHFRGRLADYSCTYEYSWNEDGSRLERCVDTEGRVVWENWYPALDFGDE